MIWLTSLTFLFLIFSQYDCAQGRKTTNSPWTNVKVANKFVQCLVQNIAFSPAFPTQEKEDLQSIAETMLSAISNQGNSRKGNTGAQAQALNMAFASSLAELVIAEDAGNAQAVATKTNALVQSLQTCFQNELGGINTQFISEIRELINVFAADASSNDIFNEIDNLGTYGSFPNAPTPAGLLTPYSFDGRQDIGSSPNNAASSTSVSTSTATSTSTAAAGAAAGSTGFGPGYGGIGGPLSSGTISSITSTLASALLGSAGFQSVFGSGISAQIASSIAVSATQSALTSAVGVSSSVAVVISNSVQGAVLNVGASASASAYASAIAGSVVSGLASAGALSSSNAYSVASAFASAFAQTSGSLGSQYGIGAAGGAAAAAASATSTSTTSTTSTAAAGAAAGSTGFGPGYGGIGGPLIPGGFGVSGGVRIPSAASQPGSIGSVLSSPLGITSPQASSRIQGLIASILQGVGPNGLDIGVFSQIFASANAQASSSGLSSSDAKIEVLLETIVALIQVLSSSSIGSVNFASTSATSQTLASSLISVF